MSPTPAAPKISSIKAFAESNGCAPIPSNYHFLKDPQDIEVAEEIAASIPVIDFSLLTSHDPELHDKGVRELGKACEEWGFFMLTNHGVPDDLVENLLTMSEKFHNMSVEEKAEFADKGAMNPIRHGTSFSLETEKVNYWRDYLKVITHPEFNFPHKPEGYKDLAFEYCSKIRDVLKILLQGASERSGLPPNAIIEATGFEKGLQSFIVNLYPPCPQPDLALGLPPHTDHGLMTLLIQNETGGLQVYHKGKWVKVDPLPKSLIVNVADQLEAVTNGRFKSVMHRAMLNNRRTRISIALANGPELDKDIGPIPELLEKEEAKYKAVNYREYFQVQQKSNLEDKGCLGIIRIDA